jgi:hypothetical protein
MGNVLVISDENSAKIWRYYFSSFAFVFCREERVRFWSDPDTELKLAQGAHQTVFRMGVDWGRIMPIEPVDGINNAVCLTVICSTPLFYLSLYGCFLGRSLPFDI